MGPPSTDVETEREPVTAERSASGRLLAIAVPIGFILLWSGGYLVGAIGTSSGPPLALLFWRFVLALVVITVVALIGRAPWPKSPVAWIHLLITGILFQTLQFGALYVGLGMGIPAGITSLVICTSPLMVAAAAGPMFGERLVARQWLGLAIGLIGVAIALQGELSGGGNLVGYAFIALALVGFTSGTLYQKRFGRSMDLRTGTAIQLLGATATTLPIAALYGGLSLPFTFSAIGSAAWLAVINSIGGFTLLVLLLRHRQGGTATSMLYLVPPVTALLGVPILGQQLAASVPIGMAISAAGVVMVNVRLRRRKKVSREHVRDVQAGRRAAGLDIGIGRVGIKLGGIRPGRTGRGS